MSDADLRARLEALTHALRPLHKALLEEERHLWEQQHQEKTNPLQLFQLVTQDPQFAWLRPLSGLMADVDARIDQKEPLEHRDLLELHARTEALLEAREGEAPSPFTARYHAMLQDHPAIGLLGGRVRKALVAL